MESVDKLIESYNKVFHNLFSDEYFYSSENRKRLNNFSDVTTEFYTETLLEITTLSESEVGRVLPLLIFSLDAYFSPDSCSKLGSLLMVPAFQHVSPFGCTSSTLVNAIKSYGKPGCDRLTWSIESILVKNSLYISTQANLVLYIFQHFIDHAWLDIAWNETLNNKKESS